MCSDGPDWIPETGFFSGFGSNSAKWVFKASLTRFYFICSKICVSYLRIFLHKVHVEGNKSSNMPKNEETLLFQFALNPFFGHIQPSAQKKLILTIVPRH